MDGGDKNNEGTVIGINYTTDPVTGLRERVETVKTSGGEVVENRSFPDATPEQKAQAGRDLWKKMDEAKHPDKGSS